MKITIEPSKPSDGDYHTVSIDTNTNEDLTGEIVEAALQIIVASGHDKRNVIEAAHEWATTHAQIDGVEL